MSRCAEPKDLCTSAPTRFLVFRPVRLSLCPPPGPPSHLAGTGSPDRYFLLIAALQFIPVIAPVSPVSTLLPLALAFLLTAAKEGASCPETKLITNSSHRRICGSEPTIPANAYALTLRIKQQQDRATAQATPPKTDEWDHGVHLCSHHCQHGERSVFFPGIGPPLFML